MWKERAWLVASNSKGVMGPSARAVVRVWEDVNGMGVSFSEFTKRKRRGVGSGRAGDRKDLDFWLLSPVDADVIC